MKTLIVGNGAAGIATVEAMRKIDTGSQITIVSDEPYLHYGRPRVSDVLSGKATSQQIVIRKREWYDRNNVEIILSEKVVRIDIADKTVSTEGRGKIRWDSLVLAIGSAAFVPPIKGADAGGVFTLRTIDDADAIVRFASGREEALVLGGGLLGIEAAYGLLARGLRVTIVEVMDRLLPKQLDSEGAEILNKMIEEKGIRILTGRKAESIERAVDGFRVSISGGESATAGLVIVSAGVRPRLDLLRGTGIASHFGILAGDRMETNVPDVWACGDAIEHKGKVYGLWAAAKEQGEVCGTNVAGGRKEYPGSIVSARLSVLGIGLASLGSIEGGAGVKTATWRDSQTYKKYFIAGGKLVGAILLGDTQDYRKLEELLTSGEDVSGVPDLLKDAEIA